MEGLPFDVWDSIIFNYLSDYDIIALSGLSQQFRFEFNIDQIYTRLFYRRWKMFKAIDPFDLDLECITRTDYMNVCHQFDEWKQKIGLPDATDIKLRQPRQHLIFKNIDCWQITFLQKQKKTHKYFNPYVRNMRKKIFKLVPCNWFDKLYEDWIQAPDRENPDVLEYENYYRRWNYRPRYQRREIPNDPGLWDRLQFVEAPEGRHVGLIGRYPIENIIDPIQYAVAHRRAVHPRGLVVRRRENAGAIHRAYNALMNNVFNNPDGFQPATDQMAGRAVRAVMYNSDFDGDEINEVI